MSNKKIKLGEIQTLQIVKTTDFGAYLGFDPMDQTNKVLLPKSQVPAHSKIGDKVTVFIYKDSEDRIIATTATPLVTIGEVAKLQVKEVTKIGAFLNWGLSKDLFLPFKEQTAKVEAGDEVLVTLYIDKSNRLSASMKVYEYLDLNSPYKKEDKVTGRVYEISDQFGAFVAVDDQYSGLISRKELFRPLQVGEIITARVITVKEDGKLDLSIREKAHLQMDVDTTLLLTKLEQNNGFLPFHDKSDPEAIKEEFNLSKNAFKRAVGRLLKEGKIKQDQTGITLL